MAEHRRANERRRPDTSPSSHAGPAAVKGLNDTSLVTIRHQSRSLGVVRPGRKYTCLSCHRDLESYVLSPNAQSDLDEMLAATALSSTLHSRRRGAHRRAGVSPVRPAASCAQSWRSWSCPG